MKQVSLWTRKSSAIEGVAFFWSGSKDLELQLLTVQIAVVAVADSESCVSRSLPWSMSFQSGTSNRPKLHVTWSFSRYSQVLPENAWGGVIGNLDFINKQIHDSKHDKSSLN